MDKKDVIERTVTVSSPIGKVWEALTEAEHLAQWFGDSAEVDLRPGGAMSVGWSEYEAQKQCVIDEVDPPSVFSFRWTVGTTEDGTEWTTKVTYTLSESAAGTTVIVVESGLSELPDGLYGRTIEENSSGWVAEMADLQQYLAGVSAP